jgi:hypothetical protein
MVKHIIKRKINVVIKVFVDEIRMSEYPEYHPFVGAIINHILMEVLFTIDGANVEFGRSTPPPACSFMH